MEERENLMAERENLSQNLYSRLAETPRELRQAPASTTGDPARLLDGALSDLWQAELPVRPRGAARTGLVSERHLRPAHRTGSTVPSSQVEQVRRWIENDHRLKERLEKISEINRELLRRDKGRKQPRKRGRK